MTNRVTIVSTLSSEEEPSKNSEGAQQEEKKQVLPSKSNFNLISRGSGDIKKRYRPQRLEELAPTCAIDQLRQFINNPDSSQVYLFEGRTGTGKTTCARIIAKANVCLDEDTDNRPCLECKHCRAFDKSSDYLEINAADHRKIDDVRKLITDMRYLPAELGKKIYIFDEIHQLTTDAQQSLLKVLEEPPAHLLIFMCTSEKQGINKALIDRANTVTFEAISPKDARIVIDQILDNHQVKASHEIKLSFYHNSGGSVRALVNNVQAFIEGGYDPEKTGEDEISVDAKELALALMKGNWEKTTQILKQFSVKKDAEKIRIGVESYMRGTILGNPNIEHAAEVAKLMRFISDYDLDTHPASHYNNLVLNALRACYAAKNKDEK